MFDQNGALSARVLLPSLKSSLVLVLFVCLLPTLKAGELTVEDFRFDGPLGSKGATIEKLGPEHFHVTLSQAPGHPEWSNMLQFTILRNAKGKRLRIGCTVRGMKKSSSGTNETSGMRCFVSWSYDGKNWTPLRRSTIKENGKKITTLIFPKFTQDRVFVGGEVPMSYEDHVGLLRHWEKHPHATLHEIGESLGGRTMYRLTVTDPESHVPEARRWVHHAVNQHCYEYNAMWRIAGMIDWLLSEEGADCRRRHICHFVVTMNVDGPTAGYARVNAQGIDLNRSYHPDGANPKTQAHESYVVQKDMEALAEAGPPFTTTWSMHTWAGDQIEMLLRPGAEMGGLFGPPEAFWKVVKKNDPRDSFKSQTVLDSKPNPSHWCSGTHLQFGASAFCCEGAGDIMTKEENLYTGEVLMKSLDQYYRGTRP